MESWSRQQYQTELRGKRAKRTPSPEFGALIAAGSEGEIQAQYFKWVDSCKVQFPVLKLVYAIPNVGSYARAQNAKLKLTGRRPGVLDCHLPVPMPNNGETPSGRWNGLWIEHKTESGVVSKEQHDWITMLRLAGHRVEISRSWIVSANITIEYLRLPLAKL